MVTEVYADLYFLINTSMNLLCLMITASLLHLRVNRLRAVLAASFGGAYAVLALLFSLEGILGIALDLLVALGMCAIAFFKKKNTGSALLKYTAVQFLTSMILGGVMTVLYTLLNRMRLPLEILQGDGLSVWTFALLSAVAGIVTARGSRFFSIARRTKSVTVNAKLFGQELTLRALVDSGNLLRDPVSGRYVIVAEKKRLSAALPPPVGRLLDAPLEGDGNTEFAVHLRLIPTQTAAGKTLLPALLPEELTVSDGKETYCADYLLAAAELGKHARGFDAVIPME